MPDPPLHAWRQLAEAVLIGLLIGAQREATPTERRAGLRDFLLVAVAGGVCGILHVHALTVTVLAAFVAMALMLFHRATERDGITTEFSIVVAFCLAYLTTIPAAAPLAIGLTVVVVASLEAKRTLHKFFRETITGIEFNDTLRFVAIVLVVFPVLPEGPYGPYGFFNPRQVWMFVILVSSISYIGYFLQKFLGADLGLKLTSVLGGLASTTAATAAFARNYREDPGKLKEYWQASTLANAIQFPRLLALLAVLNPPLALGAWPVFAAMTAAGLAMTLVLSRFVATRPARAFEVGGNPFRLGPALKFGFLFALILFVVRWANAESGGTAVFWASAIGGSVDVDSVSVSLAALYQEGKLALSSAEGGVLLALASNAVLKTGLAFTGGGAPFGWRVAFSFVVMLLAGVVTFLLQPR